MQKDFLSLVSYRINEKSANRHRVRNFLLALCLTAAFFSSIQFLVSYIGNADSFDKNHLIDDALFIETDSMSVAEIQTWLEVNGGGLLANWVDNVDMRRPSDNCIVHHATGMTAAQIIHEAATAWNAQVYDSNGCAISGAYWGDPGYSNYTLKTISPESLLVTLQKEQSLISASGGYSSDPNDYKSPTCCSSNEYKLARATGYGVPDSGGINEKYLGFYNQINWASWQLRFNFERSAGNTDWDEVGYLTYSGPMIEGTWRRCASCSPESFDGFYPIDGSPLYMNNRATAALYYYTPHTYPGFFGNYNYVHFYRDWFSTTGLFSWMANVNYRNIEVGIALLVMALVLRIIDHNSSLKEPKRLFMLAVGVGLLGVFVYSDPFWTYMLVLPLAAMALIVGLQQAKLRGTTLLLSAALLASLVVARVFDEVMFRIFEVFVANKSPGITPIGDIPGQVGIVWEATLQLFAVFRSDGLYAWVQDLVRPVNILAVITLWAAPILLFVQNYRNKHTFKITNFFAAYILFTLALMMVADNIVGANSSRYMFMLPFALSIVVAQYLSSKSVLIEAFFTAVLAPLLVFNAVYTLGEAASARGGDANNIHARLISTIESEGLTKGTSVSQRAGSTTFFSGNEIKTIPTYCDVNEGRYKLFPRQWDESILNVEAHRSFVIYDTPPERLAENCSRQAIIDGYGIPEKTIKVSNDILLYVYPYDVTNCIFEQPC